MIKTSPKTTTNPLSFIRPFKATRSSSGFTLIEMMIVLGILGALLAFGVPRMNFKNGNIKSAVRELSVLTREIRNQARLKSRTFRLVFAMNEKGAHQYWIESADAGLVSPSKALEEKQREAEASSDEAVKSAASKFQKDDRILKTEKQLPNGVYFASIETARSEDPVTEGKAYLYFTSDGLVEKSVIQLTNRKEVTWSLIVNPLTGHADILQKAVRLKDATQE